MLLKALAIITSLAAALAVAGCATLAKGTTQAITISSPGARSAVYFSLSVIGSKVVTTPATITLDKSQRSIDVVCKKRCFQDGFGVVPSHMEAMTAGDILVGGVVGLGVDAISGAMKKYYDNKQFTIVPIDGCHA